MPEPRRGRCRDFPHLGALVGGPVSPESLHQLLQGRRRDLLPLLPLPLVGRALVDHAGDLARQGHRQCEAFLLRGIGHLTVPEQHVDRKVYEMVRFLGHTGILRAAQHGERVLHRECRDLGVRLHILGGDGAAVVQGYILRVARACKAQPRHDQTERAFHAGNLRPPAALMQQTIVRARRRRVPGHSARFNWTSGWRPSPNRQSAVTPAHSA